MRFSIIVPTYNAQKHIEQSLASINCQQPGEYEVEILLIDDASEDNTVFLAEQLADKTKGLKIFKNNINKGPGFARNIGIDNACGQWILFLDSDDILATDALKELAAYINAKGNDMDLVGYNWTYDVRSEVFNENYGGRPDLHYLFKDKDELIESYISLGMDSSVIFTAFKKSLLDTRQIRFKEGVHEDVDFMLKVYFYANQRGVLDLPLYIKNNRKGSIVNSISENHIRGFCRALKEMNDFLKIHFLGKANGMVYYQGVLRALATQLRGIRKECGAKESADRLYFMLYKQYAPLLEMHGQRAGGHKDSFKTKYMMIADYFLNLMVKSPASVYQEMADFIDGIKDKNWSCYSLHHAVFMAPDEIRTCCKRFFVDNKIKGDIVLLAEYKYPYEAFVAQYILKEKKDLHVRINRGTADECRGCPYLEFKAWKPIKELEIEYISFEQSSVCNMRCSYCNETYYGGKTQKYDVEGLLNKLFEQGSLKTCSAIIWGGGEPTLNKSFDNLLTFMTDRFPYVKQRVFTNATRFSDKVNKFLGENKVLCVTSIDAGNEENFYKIRNHKGFRDVLNNLKQYAHLGSKNIIIKYIITEHNASLEELRSFAGCIRGYALDACNFQISFDFKKEFLGVESLISVIGLYTYLSDIGAQFVFLDDLLWQRVSSQLERDYDRILKELKRLDLSRGLADRSRIEEIVIWGAGIQAGFLIEKAAFFKKTRIAYLVDNAHEKINKDFLGYKVLGPEALLDSDIPILIAAVQNAPQIMENFYRLGLSKSRLIKGLVI